MSTSQQVPPPVTWAQRRNVVFLTICVEDCKSPELKMEENGVYFKGTGGTEKKAYDYKFNLFAEIDKEKSRSFIRDRNIELILVKKEEGPFWPHLLKEKMKFHWLKVDFARWKDEDDTDDEGGEGQNQDLEEMMRQMGGLGGAGGERPSLDDLEDDDSDDDDLPDLE